MMAVQGCSTWILYTRNRDAKRIPIKAGSECLIPRGTLQGGEVVAGTSTIKAFGGYRANQVKLSSNGLRFDR
jgi:hypothetical protein